MIDLRILDALLKRHSLSMGRLATEIEVSMITLRRWRSGKTRPTDSDTIKLAQLLGIDPQLIQGGVPVPYYLLVEEERESYRRGFLAAVRGEVQPRKVDGMHPWSQGWKAGADAVKFGFREGEK
jgi:transcriptional regulator with XRE-family HTH domain